MESLYEKINKWIPSKNRDNKIFDRIYNLFCDIDIEPLFDHFNIRIRKLDQDFINSVIASGAVCFIGSMFVSICQLGYVRNIEELFTFAACYILTDHYLDNDKISRLDKKNMIKDINNFINNPNIPIINPIINKVKENYKTLIAKIPKAEKHLKAIFQAEVETMYLQSNPNLSREEYLRISEYKGGLCLNAIQSLLELEVNQEEFHLGAVIQILDDLLDIDDDIKLGINTIVTHDYNTYGNLDKLLVYGVNEVDKLDKKYTLFKPGIYIGLLWAVHNHREKYSPEMLKIMDEFIYFQDRNNKENMISWISNYFK